MDPQAGFLVLSLNSSNSRIRRYIPRKGHSKSKSGCLMCRSKRVKCNEARPVCSRCKKHRTQCTYTTEETRQQFPESGTRGINWRDPPRTSLHRSPGPPSPTSRNGTSNAQLLRHFAHHHKDIFYIPGIDNVIRLSKSHSMVLNAVLAIAACHLHHVSSDNRQHRIAEHFHQNLALQDFQKAVYASSGNIEQADVDALLISAVLMNIPAATLPGSRLSDDAYYAPDPEPSESWVFCPALQDRKDRMCWLALFVGLAPLLQSKTAYVTNSALFFGETFLGDGKQMLDFITRVMLSHKIPETWILVFELNDPFGEGLDRQRSSSLSKSSEDIFTLPLRYLAYIRDLPVVLSSVLKVIQFPIKMKPRLRHLLSNRDERALWLFGFWLGLMCRFKDFWWYTGRIRSDYDAVLFWLDHLRLDHRPGVQGRLWKEMMDELRLAPTLHRRNLAIHAESEGRSDVCASS